MPSELSATMRCAPASRLCTAVNIYLRVNTAVHSLRCCAGTFFPFLLVFLCNIALLLRVSWSPATRKRCARRGGLKTKWRKRPSSIRPFDRWSSCQRVHFPGDVMMPSHKVLWSRRQFHAMRVNELNFNFFMVRLTRLYCSLKMRKCENGMAQHCSDMERLRRVDCFGLKTGFEGLARGGRENTETSGGITAVDSSNRSASNSNLRGGHRAKPSDASFGSSAVEGTDCCCAGTLSFEHCSVTAIDTFWGHCVNRTRDCASPLNL